MNFPRSSLGSYRSTRRRFVEVVEVAVADGAVVEVAARVAEGHLRVRERSVQVIAVGHSSEPFRLYRHESLSHWVYCQQGVFQRDHSQQAGFILLCECHLRRQGLVLQPDHCPAYQTISKFSCRPDVLSPFMPSSFHRGLVSKSTLRREVSHILRLQQTG